MPFELEAKLPGVLLTSVIDSWLVHVPVTVKHAYDAVTAAPAR
jgi:hypothetical protein